MSAESLDVTPVYGWGWVIAGEPRAEVPEPFTLRLEERGPPRWIGTVLGVHHEFAGRRALMSQRHTDWDGHVNIVIEPTDEASEASTGFGTVAGQTDL